MSGLLAPDLRRIFDEIRRRLDNLERRQQPATATEKGVPALAVFSKSGDLAVAAGTARFQFPFDAAIFGATAAVGTAPTGSALILDIDKNGTSVFADPDDRPTIAAGSNATADEATPDVTTVVAGDYLTVDIDQVGSTIPGADLTVFVRYLPR